MQVPKNPPNNIEQALNQKTGVWMEITREYQLITPLFGGGVETRRADSVTTIRPSEIKGHLRFWWRAIRGWQANGNLAKLLEIEESIWGGISYSPAASKVQLRLGRVTSGKEAEPFRVKKNRKGNWVAEPTNVAPSYLVFPLRPENEELREKGANVEIPPLRVGVSFTLHLRFPKEMAEEVLAALWAWETFGGIGGRTRRGFGAFQKSKADSISEATIRDTLARYSRREGWPENVPHLTPDSVIYLHPVRWQETIQCYERFRQWRTRNNQGNPGRSRWPEPDAIRKLTGKWDPRHAPNQENLIDKFPRGQFGLPIIFHFKDNQDPPDSTLMGKSLERHASPLAFRPLGEDGPTLVYVLEGNRRLPEPYLLKVGKKKDPVKDPVEVELSPDEARAIEPLARTGGLTDPVLAFVEWLKGGCKR